MFVPDLMTRVHPISPPQPIAESPVLIPHYAPSETTVNSFIASPEPCDSKPFSAAIFPHHLYQALASIHMVLGLFSVAVSSYDITLYLRPDWFQRGCPMHECTNHSVVYSWFPWNSLSLLTEAEAWLIPGWPALAGVMVIINTGLC